MADGAKKIVSLSADKLRRLMDRLKQGPDAAERISRALRDGTPLPLSYSQERLWFLDRLGGGTTAYNLPAAVRLSGLLEADALGRAFEEVVRRHESLRARFGEQDGTPFQWIAPEAALALPRIDLSGLPEERREIEAMRWATEAARLPFDLSHGPLLRTFLLRLSAGEHVLALTLHHIASDGWSMGVLIREVAVLYAAFVAGKPSPLPELPLQYTDYAIWQRDRLQGEVLERELAFWRERLAGAPPLDLPPDRPRPAAQSFRGARREIALTPEETRSLHALARREGVTPFMALLTLFQILLLRFTGQTDLAVGSPLANRDRSEVQDLIGFFVNTLVLRVDLSSLPSVSEALRRVRETAVAAYEHAELPFEKLVEELRPEREAGRNPLFQALFTLQDQAWPATRIGDVDFAPADLDTGTAKLDLTLIWREQEDCLLGWLEYATDLFEDATAERLLRHGRTLLRGAAESPEQSVGELPLLDPEEQQQILVGWNRTAAEYPRDTPVHRLVLSRAESEPERVAIEDENREITYRELRERAGTLAAHLRSLGVGPESRVGFCLERSADLGVTMLGILAAGSAYVPLDPGYPQERLAFMVEDAAVSVVITEERLLPKLPADLSKRGIAVLSTIEAPARSGTFEAAEVSGDGLAYILYTSGSTGRPKGVAVPHRAINRLVLGTDYVQLTADDRIAQVSNSSFDAATFEVWGALVHGARLVGVDRNVLLSPRRFAGFLRERRITALFLTTALFQQIVREVPDAFATVHHLLFGGETADPRRVREALAAGPERLLHVYGPTEGTTFTTWHQVTALRGDAASVPIGRPIANTRVYVVDAPLQPVPAGFPGELLAGGDGLARGYLGRPELTAERFIPSPFAGGADEPGARLYRTGDRVRWRDDGGLEFLGRIDAQVKIRGFRIEPGEVEAAVASHPAVRDAVVLVVEADGDRHLVAWVARHEPGAAGESELRSWLEQRLPAYMVPARCAFLDVLPLTPNGKVDRRALLQLTPAFEPSAKGGGAPRTAAEEILAGAMASLLRREGVGIHDDFFELGGHSLLAARLVSRVRELLGVEIELRNVFEAPTVAELALRIEEARRGGTAEPAPPLARRDEAADPPPLSFAQRRLWFLDRLEPGSTAYNVPLLLDLAGPLAPAALAAALAEVERRHEALRTVFTMTGGEPVQVVRPAEPRPLPLVDLGALPEAARRPEAVRLSEEQARRPFDLEQGPLLRTALLRLGAEEHRLLLTFHHAVVDGWSVEIVVRELSALLSAKNAGVPSPLPEPALQYADFALWQRRWLSGTVQEALLAHWRERLAGAPAVLALPTDRPRPAVQSHRGAAEPLVLDASLAASLGTLSRQARTTLFMTLLAAFETLLSRSTGQEDLLVGSPVAGRSRAEVFGVVGLFVNTLPFRGDLSGDPGFLDLLARTREAALEAYAHQDLPFERLVEELAPERSLSRSALIQALFLLQNDPALPAELAPGLGLQIGEPEGETAKLDLKLALAERDGELSGVLEYATDLFDAATIERMAGHFRTLLEGIAAAPGTRLSELPLLTGEERRQLLAAEATEGLSADSRPVHERFREWATRTPGAIAVVCQGQALTYRELDRRANRLAHRLRNAGVGPDVLVALCLERSLDLVTAIFATFKAGGAYLPLDSELPAERRLALLDDSGARVLVTREGLAGAFAGRQLSTLIPDAGENPEGPALLGGPDNLAYVLYTSGSTGQPKGVMVEHRQLAAYVDGVLARLELPAGARYAMASTFAADLGNTVLYAALTTGGSLRVLSAAEATDADRMAEALEWQPADCLKIVPSHLTALLSAERPERVLPRKLLVLGGEALPWTLVDRVRELAPGCRVLNHYGPTETTVGVLTCPTWSAGHDGRGGPGVPLGRPLAGTRAIVLDARLQPMPQGLPGELLVGGPQVSRGYLGRPDLTAERFVPDPAGAPGERMYRTGDLVRRRPEGDFVFLGRIDQQVKIRGFRVEPGEVGAALLAHPAVREALVLGRPTPGGETRLVGYVVPRGEVPAGFDRELRAWLGERLPDAMVPAALVVLQAFPLTPNGKVDRRALPEPAPAAPAEAAALLTPTEELLAGLFEEVLETGRVGAEDGFFERGGHSLLATRLLARARQAFGVDVELRALFERPTVRAMAARIDELRRAGRTAAEPPLVPRDRQGDLPLSFAQERLWFLEQLDPGSTVYNVPRAFRLEGKLSTAAFAAALAGIVRRHEAVRTTFTLVDGAPVQRVAEAGPVAVPLVDLSALAGPKKEAEARRLAGEEAGRLFDLGRGPLLRALLLRQAHEDHVALVTMHHLASDGWSVGVLVRELTALYGAFAAGRPSPLPELPLQYADFALWQRERLSGARLAAELAWWKSRLDGAPEALEIPADHPRPAVRSLRGSHLPIALGAPVSRALNGLVRRQGATLFMGLLAGFQALLGRSTGQEDLLVGSPVANRTRAEVTDLIGFFVNTLVLRAETSDDPPFAAFLDQVREQALAAYDHQDLPFEKLVEELQPERSLARSPLVQVTLALQNAPLQTPALRGLRLTPLPGAGSTAKFDLSLVLEENEDGISGTIEYSTDLFEAATVARLAGHLGVLLAEAVAAPERRLSELPILTAQERAELLAWNNTGEVESAACLHELFEAQVIRTPDAVALIDGTRRWTYRELDARANALAHRLIRMGVAPEVTVAVCLDRTGDLPAALLAVLKAGGAYVPLDPAWPRERLAFLLEDSGAAVLLTRKDLAEGLGGTTPTLALDNAGLDGPDGPDRGAPVSGVSPGHLAYVIYTSGSTGRPKGVGIEHRSAAALVHWARRTFSAEELAGVLAATSVSFDLSVFELFVPLATGGTAILAANALELPNLPAADEVTLVNTVPSAITVLARQGGIPSSVRTVNLAGEPLGSALAREVAGSSRARRIWNLYGPTEDTTYSTAATVRLWEAREPSIGRPLPGTRAHALDPHGRQVPVGIPGELHLSGAGLARGYLGRPDLTAGRFVPDPFSLEPGARLYRTGDLVRRRPGGDLDFLGRLDHQVKIRGVRIELGEVEAALLGEPEVREAVAVVREDQPGERRLIAYVAAAPEVETSKLRERLRQRLPDALVPSAIVRLESLPKTPNGKVDRKALPAPDWTSGASWVAPRTLLEELLAGIWEELLGQERVSVCDSFFDLGGHSLLATRMLARVRAQTGVDLPVRRIFEAPTIEKLALAIESARGGTTGSTGTTGATAPAVPLLARRQHGDLPLSFSQERLWFLDRMEPGAPTYNMPGRVELTGRLDVAALTAALRNVVDRHEVLRTVFRVIDGEPRQHILAASDIELPLLDLGGLPPAERLAEADRLAVQHARHRFDLANGPLIKAALLRLGAAEGEDRHHLLVVLHHVICDGWSLTLLVREVGALYAAFSAGRPSPLAELPIQYADFAVWQRERVAASRQTELSYWLDRLGGEIAPLELPTDRSRPAVQTYRGGQSTLLLSSGLAARLHAFGRAHGSTLFMTLFAAIQALLHRHSGQDDILIGAPVAGRRAVETEELIGCFLNNLVLRTDLGGRPGFRELVARVREVTLGAWSHQDVPFEAVLAALPQQRDLSRTPLFQVMVNLLNLPSAEMSLPGLTLESRAMAMPSSKLDMTFYVREGDGRLRIELVYNADLFDAARTEDLLAQLESFLDQALDRPDESIGTLSLVTAAARAVLPDPAAELSATWEGAVHEVFAQHARRTPEALAVADPVESWTYGELDERSSRLAAFLHAAGVRPGDVVAFWAHRSAPLVWGVLGALKAGAAFLMLDPRYPAPRQAQMLGIARPAAWLRVEAAGPVPVEIEKELDAIGCSCRLELPARAGEDGFLGDISTELPTVDVEPDDVAYVAFTSGSTGIPKGVLGRHGSLSHFLPWLRSRFELSAADRYSMLSGLAHDPLHRDLFTPLQTGAAIVIPDPETMDEPGRLAAWMHREAVTVAHLTPALGQVLTTEAPNCPRVEVPSLRWVFLVGDVLTRRDVARLRRLAPAVTVVNYYGSTETQRAVGYHVAEANEPKEILPLGRGIPDVQILVLNPSGALAGIGELGEIWVRSPHIALGYLGDPQLTAERFVADRYRTGDLGRYLPNGEAVFAGRADTQVKIRGFRIELGEIESVLGGFPGVREAVVIARQDRGPERYLAAYVVPATGVTLAARELRAFLRERLPDSMVPATFTLLAELPLTPNRKVDRKALPAPEERAGDTAFVAAETDLEREIAAVWQEVLGIGRVGVHDNFFEIGGHSLLLVRLHARLQETLKVDLSLMDLFSHPNVHAQAEHIRRRGTAGRPAALRSRQGPAPLDGRIAIVGMTGRFPGARDLEAFWRNLRDGVESVSFFTPEEMLAGGVPPELVRHPSYVAARAVVDGEDLFDAAFFEYPPRQAELMDPQHRFFLEAAWHALESAGIDPDRFPGSIGVYGGVTASTYLVANLLPNARELQELGAGSLLVGTDRDFLTTHVSYKLGLRGPSLDVQTACSTSLVATHLACQALIMGDCDVALAGGVSIKVPQRSGYLYHVAGPDSSDGHCRAFDARADGSIYGAGVGLVVLKRLEDAIADGDVIHAVVLGTAINNDGSQKVGFTAPSIEGQSAVVALALDRAGVEPATIDYVECHGSGTALGDPIEVTALSRAFGDTGAPGTCAIGSVKTNIGHLGAAAGVTGLIKTVLALEHREIPPSLNFETPNPKIDFAASPFRVNDRLSPWPAVKQDGRPRRAGVNSLGQGGTNAHVVLEEAPEREPSGPSRPCQLLVISARTETALEAATANLAAWLGDNPGASLADTAFTLQVGRRAFSHRRALVCRDVDEAQRILTGQSPRHLLTGVQDGGRCPVAFLLPGVGDHYPGMARRLYATEPVFRAALDRCFEILAEGPCRDLREALFSGGDRPAAEGMDLRRMLGRRDADEAAQRLHRTLYAQPAVFAVEYALASLWMSWGVQPEALLGYSLGEYVAACLAGIFPLEDALLLVAERARWIEELPAGAMLAVPLPEDETRSRLTPGLDLAAVNGPQLSVVSGPPEAVAALAHSLEEEGIPARQLPTTHAFHSRGMEPLAERLTERVARLRPAVPRIPLLSNVTGTWLTPDEATDPAYWARHLCGPVRFSEGLAELWKNPSRVLLEVGPGNGLSAIALQHPAAGHGRIAVPSLPHAHERQDDDAFLLGTLGRLWLAGVAVDWAGFSREERRHRLELPLYPFEHRRFWVEAPRSDARLAPALLSPAAEEAQAPAPAVLSLSQRPRLPHPYVAPRNPTEEWIAGQIERLLGIAGVGIHDSFFELGGHSLLGTQLLTRLRDGLGVELSVETLFDAPTAAELAQAVAAAGPARRLPPILPVPRDGKPPLSYAQERLWFLDQLEPGSPLYNLPVALRVRGSLDPAVLALCLGEIVRRHEALRTAFEVLGGSPVQVVRPAAPFRLPVVDLSDLPEEPRETLALLLTADEAARPFDLACGSLLRGLLLRLAEGDYILAMTLHHVASDGWSLRVLVREVAALYPAFAEGRPSPLPGLPVQYADFALWQREWLRGPVREPQLAWWKQELTDLPSPLELPAEHLPPAVPASKGGAAYRLLAPELSRRIEELGHKEGTTPFMTLLAALAALLHRYTGQEDLVLGTPIAGRTQAETESLIGFFLNTLALRVDLSGDPTVRELLGRVRQTVLGASDHQDVPFELLLEEIRPKRNLSRTPLFRIVLNWLGFGTGKERFELPGVVLDALPQTSLFAKFDLEIYAGPSAGRISLHAVYNRDLFAPQQIDDLLTHLEALLEGMVAGADRRLSDLSLAVERSAVRPSPIAAEESRFPREVLAGSILERFAAQVAAHARRAAVVAPGAIWTYTELGREVDRVAHALLARHVAGGERIAILFSPEPSMVAAVLGTLAAGAAYVPLDPGHPRERLREVLADSGAVALLACDGQRSLAGELAVGLQVLCFGDLPPAPPHWTPPQGTPEASAYLLYTSGSTGRPKGVLQSQRNVLGHIRAYSLRLGLGPEDRLLLLARYGFDAAVMDLFGALLNGAALCLWDLKQDGMEGLGSWIAEQEITVFHSTPSVYRAFLDHLRPGEGCPSLRLVVLGGEEARRQDLERFREAFAPGCRLINGLGPTESTLALQKFLDRDEQITRAGLPVGWPVEDVRVRLSSGSGEQPATWGVGEIEICSPYLAVGYWGLPGLTAERFTPDPEGPPGARLYRTGDLARRLPGGELEFLGRADGQVKVRGYRIETGEIEAALVGHPCVQHAVVLMRSDQLIAYLVPATERTGAAELRTHLHRSLPDYMVPADFVYLRELPLTANGKVDRRALPNVHRKKSSGELIPPRGTVEEALSVIWTQVLGVDCISVHDNFFDVGGHSLRLIEVQAGIRRVLGRELPIVELFRHPTIASLASFLKGVSHEHEAPRPRDEPRKAGTDIAIIAMEGMFPGAPDLERFWNNLRNGIESIIRLSDEQLLEAGLDPGALTSPDLVRAEARVDGIDMFDASFFGFSPREAQALDPQQRLFLEQSWTCLERAGYDPARHAGRIGVFAGSGMATYAFNLFSNSEICEALGSLSLHTAIDKDYLATRVSYKLGLRGPSLSVQTACSTSLVAVHLARQSLLAGECEMALAGGVTLKIRQGTGYRYREGAILSPDGHCRSFDATAQGTVFGSGAGVVLLKSLDDALRDGDTIHAVLKGSAINNDGSIKVGYTAPSVEGQAEVIAAAHEAAGVSPDSITYVEAHGTATPLGDPIEVAALTQAFRRGTDRTGFCALGSVKTNIGHLDAAAGVTGLIKTVLALEHRQIPPSLHFETPNPAIDFAASPFRVVNRLTDWEANGGPRRAGVSSFGIGGTNAHAVLEEAPPAAPSGASRPFQLLLLSARTAGALEEATTRLATWLEGHPEAPLADVAYTLRVGRQPFEHRRMLVCTDREDALAALQSRDPEKLVTRRRESVPPPTAWLLPGQGSQHPGMGRDLYGSEPVFRREIDLCAEILAPRLGRDLRALLFASASAELAETRFAQPALFAVEHALARLWLSWGLRPQALIGHSLGEYVAACLAGVLSVEDALTLVAARGELMQELPPGAMLSVDLSEAEALAEIASAPGLSLAAVNSPGQCVLSGPAREIEALAGRLGRLAISCRRLHTSHAFHSEMMEPILGRFADLVARVELRPPALPYLSNLTGTWITASEAMDPGYWTRHLRATVRFADGVSRLLADLPAGTVLLEVGPGRALSRLVRSQAMGRTVLASLPQADSQEPGLAALLHTLGRLWLLGVEIDWQAFQGEERRRRIPLPTYPFQRRRHWIEPGRASLAGAASPVALVLPEGAAADPAWASALAAQGFRVVAVPPDRARPEDLRDLLAVQETSAPEPAPAEEQPGSGHARPGIDTPYEAPRTEVEQQLAAIWGDLLGIDRVGIHDDFFELGGHSLLVTRLLSRLRNEFQCEIQMETIFAEPTIARLAVRLASGEEPPAPQAAPILPVPRTEKLPLSFAQQRLLFLSVMNPGDPTYNMPLGLRLDGRLDTRTLGLALDAVVARHEPLRTTFCIDENRVTQVIAPAASVPLPLADLAGLPEELREAEARRLAREQSCHPFNLLRGPVMVALLVRLGAAEHLLLLTMHHIAADGWSFAVLYRDMTELYQALVEGRSPRLPELPVQYADFAAWQRTALQEEALERQIDYWRTHLAGARALALPTDLPRPQRSAGRGLALLVTVPEETMEAAHRLARDEDATLFMVLLAGFAVLLHRASGCDDLSIGTDIANRNRRETEDLIGLFVNQLVLRNDLSGNPTFRELVRRVRRTTLKAYAHQDAPFDRLVDALNPVRDLGTTPLFQVKLVLQNVQNAQMPVQQLTDLQVSPYGVPNQTAKFDLLLNLTEMGDALSGLLEYRSDLWEIASMRRLIEDFATALAAGTSRPDESISRIEDELSRPSLPAAEERRTILKRRVIPVQ